MGERIERDHPADQRRNGRAAWKVFREEANKQLDSIHIAIETFQRGHNSLISADLLEACDTRIAHPLSVIVVARELVGAALRNARELDWSKHLGRIEESHSPSL